MIKLEDCEHGYLYEVRGRNLGIGIFNKSDNSFHYIRTKFNFKFIDKEFHWDTGAPYGTAKPIKKLKYYGTDFDEETLFEYLKGVEKNGNV
jgi:hypothetical protein